MKVQNNKYHFFIGVLIFIGLCGSASAQEKSDTVILNVGKSKIIFLVKDKNDLATMQQYDLNEVLDKLTLEITGDSSLIRKNGQIIRDTVIVVKEQKSEVTQKESRKRRRFRTQHAFNFDLGTNNYLSDG
ncbi:MAG: hypothetical protein R3345_12595, partial [Fulvivirga sp.]|nr:hypothetical protein [Fulvivirga sp.]